MSDCKIYPADTVDIYGNVWPTVGENIRNGMFGENVKCSYININKGKVTSKDFIISQINDNDFRIENIKRFFIFPESIEEGSLRFNVSDEKSSVFIHSVASLNTIIATIKIIYKELV